MGRLTEKDGKGNWQLKNLPWDHMRCGHTLTRDDYEVLYGALCKLKTYEDTDLEPDDVERVNTFMGSQAEKLMIELQNEKKKHSWIPIEERLPEPGKKVLLSFVNFTQPVIGRYEEDDDGGGNFYEGDSDEPLIQFDLFVNAWMPLPERYREE